MEMSGFRLNESSHVAQQSRRSKLRDQQITSNFSGQDFDQNVPNNTSAGPDLVHVRNVRNARNANSNLLFDPTLFSSPELLNFSINANRAFSSSVDDQDLGADNTQNNYGNCRSWFDPPQSLDNWVTNYTSGTSSNHNMFVREVNNMSPSTPYLKPTSTSHHGYQHYSPHSSIYHNTLQDVVATASTGGRIRHHDGMEMPSWTSHGYAANQSTALVSHDDPPSSNWMDRPIGTRRRNWNCSGELGSGMSDYSNPQGLSLSLSSNPTPPHVQGLEASKSAGSGYLCSMTKPSIISKACVAATKSLQEIVGTSTTRSTSGPLGPFTGYATILKSSKFLKPAKCLLEEFCKVGRHHSNPNQTCEASRDRLSWDRASASVSISDDQTAHNATETSAVGNMGRNNSGASLSAFYGSNEISSDCGATASTTSESFLPEYQQNKAKLLYMEEEVCRRYKQYHQQMEMVVSLFESVAGLSSATPYMSLALNTVSRHFKCLTNSIKDRLNNIRKALGKDFSSAMVSNTTGGSGSGKSNKSLGKMKYMGLDFQDNRSAGGINAGFVELEPQQHVWRPQRGLPDRSVAILRAWLFDHFLHPYPTDTDKHMLATQTGLSRNQVSNWFINARVRVWKPMVEEIHMLETRKTMEASQDPRNKDGISPTEGTGARKEDGNAPTEKTNTRNNGQFGTQRVLPSRRLEGSSIDSSRDAPNVEVEDHNQEMKRSRTECQVPSSMDSTVMGFVPYSRNEMEVGELGAVSLTLGLRHGVESAQQQQHQQQLEEQENEYQYQLRRQLGGHMIHDFVG